MKPKAPGTSWTHTLRLPQSKFPPRPILSQRDEYIKKCTDDLYQWQSATRSSKVDKGKAFILHDGPPYANGNLHVGHALNKILKDVIIRHKIQQGRRVQYVPGWDCHGLPIELKALAKPDDSSKTSTSSPATDLPPTAIRKAARALAAGAIETQMAEFRSYAVMADWNKRWTTMDPDYEIRQLQLFHRMLQRSLIYRSFKPVYWSPSSRTALAEAELEYNENHKSTAAYVKFPMRREDAKWILGAAGADVPIPPDMVVSLLVWTTTPWTLPANRAIAVNYQLKYDLVSYGSKEILIVASDRLDAVREACVPPDAEPSKLMFLRLAQIEGAQVHGRYINKLQGKNAQPQIVTHGDFVTAESGTGIVHLAPGHGFDDYQLCKKWSKAVGIDISPPPVDDAGRFTAEAYPDDPKQLKGLHVQKAGGPAVLKLMGDDVIKVHTYKHKYPYDWRTKEPVIIRATPQWFANVDLIGYSASTVLEEVKFVPESGRRRLEAFVEGRKEWCISRQRSWGVPIPALYDKDDKEIVTEEVVDHLISVMRERGTDAWWSDAPDDPAWIPASLRRKAAAMKYRRGTDTMDVWFDSGCSWTQTDRQADLYLEGSDQHRGWFQSSLLTKIAGTSDGPYSRVPPFKALITHGFTLDAKGKKMSKSLGNIISPQQVMDGTLLPPVKRQKNKGDPAPATPATPSYEALGPDALRLWACSSDYTSDVVIGVPVLKAIHTALIKYRTTIRVLLGSVNKDTRDLPLTGLDQIALVQLLDAMKEVGEAYDNYEFAKAFRVLNNYVVNDLSAFYLEALKDRLYCGDGGGVLEPILIGLLRMLAPMTPVLVEEAWAFAPEWLRNDKSIPHPLKQLYNTPLISLSRINTSSHLNPENLRKTAIPALQAVHSAIKAASERARRDKRIGSSLQCHVILEIPDEALGRVLAPFSTELADIMVVSSLELRLSKGSPEAVEGELGGRWSYAENFINPDSSLEKKLVECTAWVVESEHGKCPRCWRYAVEKEESEGSLCERCEDVVTRDVEPEVLEDK